MASTKTALAFLARDHSVPTVLDALSERLGRELAPREFVALLYARFLPADGVLELANAGLPDPYLLRPGQRPRPLAVDGPRLPLGLRRGRGYRSLRLELAVGDRVLFLTDGMPEALTAAGEPLGYEALESLLAEQREEPPAAWLDGLVTRVREHTVGQDDDWTALLLERTP